MVVTLRAADGHWASMLRLHLSKSAIIPIGQSCELIAICSGDAESSADESYYLEGWTNGERQTSRVLYRFYNVLWVSRKDGWITRLTLSRVEKSIREQKESEEMEFKMH
jgi:hypothetical protein